MNGGTGLSWFVLGYEKIVRLLLVIIGKESEENWICRRPRW
jgi:hypothetical protein